ncbi:MAG: sulfite exporter TauE/SafE family protein [Oscillospiraceae bacterium]|jgi:uncharacterized protein
MELFQTCLLIVISLLASFIQGCTGFGYAIVSMSLLPLILPYKLAVTATAASSFVMVLYFAVKLRKHIHLKLLFWPLISSTVTSFAGVFLLANTSETWIRHILGLVLFCLSLYFIFLSNKIHISQTPANGLIAGTVSGIFNGLFNLGGPPMVVYFISAADDKMQYHATMQCYFAINGVIVLFSHAVMGDFNMQVMQCSGMLLIGVAIGCLAGFALFRRISADVMRRLVYGCMMILGIYLLIAG